MSETQQLISKLDNKVDNLIAKIDEVNLTKENQLQEIDRLNKLLAEKEESIQNLVKEKESVVVVEEKQDNDEIKTRINELVREIDSCISLLKV